MTLLTDVSPADVWGDTDQALICRQVQQVTHDVRTFLFEPERPALFRHQPGQFATLHLEIDGVPVSRCYTISTPPTRPHLLGITVKRQPGGLVSNWLHDTMVPGRRIMAEGPFGVFSYAHHPAPKYLFLSGGSGVTPLMSMTRTLYDLGSDADVVFVHSARTPADVIFDRELDAIASTVPNIRVTHVCEHGTRGGLSGFLTIEMLRLLAPDLHERTVFCCGPAPYMAAVRALLEHDGFDLRSYHEESFNFEQPSVVDGGNRSSETGFTIEFARTGASFSCPAGTSILDAAFEAGLNPPSSCGQGMCGTCKTTLLAGDVDMNHNGGIRPREVAQGKVLICCSTPLSDLTIDS